MSRDNTQHTADAECTTYTYASVYAIQTSPILIISGTSTCCFLDDNNEDTERADDARFFDSADDAIEAINNIDIESCHTGYPRIVHLTLNATIYPIGEAVKKSTTVVA